MPCDGMRSHLQASTSETTHVVPEPVEEARWKERLKYFHPTEPGQVLNGKFKTIAKLGYGRGSTVWLAENLEWSEQVTLQLANADHNGSVLTFKPRTVEYGHSRISHATSASRSQL
ncbi:hypothetical protein E4U38_006880 [Claviceps purpurea]|nr:hypothetical protein E4U38_006880 [Claviceps purpurea]